MNDKMFESELNSEYNYDHGVFDHSQHPGYSGTEGTMFDGSSMEGYNSILARDRTFMNNLALNKSVAA